MTDKALTRWWSRLFDFGLTTRQTSKHAAGWQVSGNPAKVKRVLKDRRLRKERNRRRGR